MAQDFPLNDIRAEAETFREIDLPNPLPDTQPGRHDFIEIDTDARAIWIGSDIPAKFRASIIERAKVLASRLSPVPLLSLAG